MSDVPTFRPKPDRRRPGRPTLAPDQKRSRSYLVRLTHDEAQRIKTDAYNRGHSVAYMLHSYYFSSGGTTI